MFVDLEMRRSGEGIKACLRPRDSDASLLLLASVPTRSAHLLHLVVVSSFESSYGTNIATTVDTDLWWSR